MRKARQPSDEELRTQSLVSLMPKYGMTYNQLRALRRQRGVVANVPTPRQRQPLSDPGFTKEDCELFTDREISVRLGVSIDTVQQRRQARGWPAKSHARKVEYEDDEVPDPTTPEALRELVDAYAAVKALDKKYDPRRHTIPLKVHDERPIGIVFTGDWQLGSWGVDVPKWQEDMDALQDYRQKNPDALYAIGMGDYVSNLGVLNVRGSQFRDLIRPGFQNRITRAFFRQTAGMWLGLLSGCHDTFGEQAADDDPVVELVKLAGARHFWHGVEVTMKLGDERYTLRVRHRYRYNSTLNELNSQRQQAAMEGPADVIAHAHFHTAVSGTMKAGGRPTIMLRSGSYQIHDDYARQRVGNVKAEPIFPMVLFWPDHHKTLLFHDFHDGLDHLSVLRR